MTYDGAKDLPLTLVDWFSKRPLEHAIITYRAKMTMFEMVTCLEVSTLMNVPIEEVLLQMAAFKETSEHLLYKKDFLFV